MGRKGVLAVPPIGGIGLRYTDHEVQRYFPQMGKGGRRWSKLGHALLGGGYLPLDQLWMLNSVYNFVSVLVFFFFSLCWLNLVDCVFFSQINYVTMYFRKLRNVLTFAPPLHAKSKKVLFDVSL